MSDYRSIQASIAYNCRQEFEAIMDKLYREKKYYLKFNKGLTDTMTFLKDALPECMILIVSQYSKYDSDEILEIENRIRYYEDQSDATFYCDW
jgi:hypothetical protein